MHLKEENCRYICLHAMRLFLKLFKESVIIAFLEVFNNRLRAFLSLLGITIGIFCIISVFTAVDSLESNVRDGLQTLGENVIYVQRFPWAEDPRSNWWKINRRPFPTEKEFRVVQEKSELAEAVVLILQTGNKVAKQGSYSVENVNVIGVTYDYHKILDFDFEDGRYFSVMEMNTGSNTAVIGALVAEELFPDQNNIVGKTISILGQDVMVAGVLKKQGEDIISSTPDDRIFIPYRFIRQYIKPRAFVADPIIAVRAGEGVTNEQMKDEVRGIMRNVRKLKPKEEDDFALNQLSSISSILSSLFSVINFAGWIIGFFSILVGGFGVANIMFVSVKERTNLIGIKKALGAKSMYILLEFLVEAIILCLLGGAIGLALVFAESFLLEWAVEKYAEMKFNFTLTTFNIMLGVGLSVIIGVISGIIPAILASRMRPVDAIRSK